MVAKQPINARMCIKGQLTGKGNNIISNIGNFSRLIINNILTALCNALTYST